uniref:Zinc knuckle CX2CX4HX4C n=1 Tax=Tanacetum cinerariifolium TaxID=118510 RepID=A0A699GVC6_TANCI|nr:zinc knuckle CX2CX4HX4C [Tanacetum cinerariifolium]
MVQNAVAQAILTTLQRLPTANQQHVGTSRPITTRHMKNETNIPIFKIFDHFWNMHPDNLQQNPMNRRDIARNTVGQSLLTPLSCGYVQQDVKDRVIKPVVIMNFPNIGQTNMHLNYPYVGHQHVADEDTQTLFEIFLQLYLLTVAIIRDLRIIKRISLLGNLTSKVRNIDGKLVGKECVDNVHESASNEGIKVVYFTFTFEDNTSKKTVHLSELKNDECVSGANVPIWLALVDEVRYNTCALALIGVSFTYDLVDSLNVAIPFQNGSRHPLEIIDIEYEWKPPRCDTCKVFDHTDEHCPKKPKTTTSTPVTDDGFVEVNQKGKGKHASKPRHIDGIRSIKPKANYFYRPYGKLANVHGEASTSQPKETVHTNTESATIKDQDDMFETDKSDWQKSNSIKSTVNDSGTEEVETVFVEDNGKSMNGLVDDARKKVEAPPKKNPRKTGIWSGIKADSPKRNVAFSLETKVHYFERGDIKEVEHENAYSKKS